MKMKTKKKKVSIISYKTKNPGVSQALFGFTSKSNYARYEYKREGFLSGRWHVRLGRGVVMVTREDEERVLEVLRGFGAEFRVYRCVLETE